MSEFSRDSPGPQPRFRPGPGQTGEHAALQALRPPPQHRQQAHGARQARGGGGQRQSSPLGMGQRQEQEPDNSHLLYAAMHENSQQLGRELPFGLWALHNGHFSDLAPGKVPVDWLD